jgi:riboflavin synthase
MFSGLVDDVGTIERLADSDAGRELVIRARYDDLVDGESIAVNGACLTVREHGAGWFSVAAIVTTLDRTTVAAWRAGTRVNLERAMRVGDRIGGHMVLGHVVAVGRVVRVAMRDDELLVVVALPGEVAELVVPHGSITIDGVSLTVNDIPEPGAVQLSLIEYTLRHTTLGALAVGDAVHVEGDVIGKYVRRLVAPHLAAGGSSATAGRRTADTR